MSTQAVRIVDIGRGPQIEGHRLTVMDVFYYLHRGHELQFIQRAMPSLTREQFDEVVEYVNAHRDELVEEDRLVEECINRGIAEQKANGLHHEIDLSATVEERAAWLKEKLHKRRKVQAEKTK